MNDVNGWKIIGNSVKTLKLVLRNISNPYMGNLERFQLQNVEEGKN